ncbi:MAG: alpha/beta hydrolase, partial [Halanaerobiales bacterium]
MKLKVNQSNHFDIKRETEKGDLYLQGWSPAGESKAVICLVHGLGEHSERYSDLAQFFNRNNFSLFAIDLPGHGKSFGPRGHISSYKVMMDIVAILLEEGQ